MVIMFFAIGLELGVMVMHVDFAARHTGVKILHQARLAMVAGNGFLDAFYEGVDDV